MNKFIEITNQIISKKLKDIIKISRVQYSIVDEIFQIKVSFYTNDFVPRGFLYNYCASNLDEIELKRDFEHFIYENFGIDAHRY